MMDERSGHGDALAHALGVLADHLALDGKFEHTEEVSGALAGGQTVEAIHAADELQELRAAEAVEEQRFVRHQANTTLDLELLFGKLEAKDLDGTAAGRNEAGEHTNRGGFTGAVGPEKA